MKIKPLQRIYHAFDKDERQDAEEKRIKLLLQLLCEMELPPSRLQFLKLKSQRVDTLKWLQVNLAVNNSHHKNYKRACNLINLALRNVSET